MSMFVNMHIVNRRQDLNFMLFESVLQQALYYKFAYQKSNREDFIAGWIVNFYNEVLYKTQLSCEVLESRLEGSIKFSNRVQN